MPLTLEGFLLRSNVLCTISEAATKYPGLFFFFRVPATMFLWMDDIYSIPLLILFPSKNKNTYGNRVCFPYLLGHFIIIIIIIVTIIVIIIIISFVSVQGFGSGKAISSWFFYFLLFLSSKPVKVMWERKKKEDYSWQSVGREAFTGVWIFAFLSPLYDKQARHGVFLFLFCFTFLLGLSNIFWLKLKAL